MPGCRHGEVFWKRIGGRSGLPWPTSRNGVDESQNVGTVARSRKMPTRKQDKNEGSHAKKSPTWKSLTRAVSSQGAYSGGGPGEISPSIIPGSEQSEDRSADLVSNNSGVNGGVLVHELTTCLKIPKISGDHFFAQNMLKTCKKM